MRATSRVSVILDLSALDKYVDWYTIALRLRLAALVADSTRIEEVFLVDRTGKVAVSFIGKEIVSKGNSIQVTSGQPVACEFSLAADAKRVAVSIYDAAGNFVKDIQATALKAGSQSLSWDGKDLNGNAVSNGAYTFEVQAEGTGGEKLGVTTYSKGTVTGVTFEDGVTYLIVGGRKIAIGDVTQVSHNSAATAA